MKKIIKSMMALSMAGCMVMPIMAEEKPMTLTASKPSEYVLTVPEKIEITYNTEKTELKGVKVTGNVKPHSTVSVTAIKKDLKRDESDDVLAYSLMDGEKEFESTLWNEDELRSENKEIPLSVNISKDAWKNAKAGDYTGSIVFTATLNEKK